MMLHEVCLGAEGFRIEQQSFVLLLYFLVHALYRQYLYISSRSSTNQEKFPCAFSVDQSLRTHISTPLISPHGPILHYACAPIPWYWGYPLGRYPRTNLSNGLCQDQTKLCWNLRQRHVSPVTSPGMWMDTAPMPCCVYAQTRRLTPTRRQPSLLR